MAINLNRYAPSIAAKLIIAVGALMCIVGILFSVLVYRYEERMMLGGLTDHARFAADLLMRGVHQGMLHEKRDLIESTIERIAQSGEVSGIRLYTGQGRVALAASAGDVGAEADPLVAGALSGAEERSEFLKGPDGVERLRFVLPIPSEPSCSQASCHVHAPQDRVLGALDLSVEATPVLRRSRQLLYGTFAFGAVYTVIISVAIVFILYVIVTRPIGMLQGGMDRLSRGDFEHPIDIRTGDEMERLASAFNEMTGEIRRSRDKLQNWARELHEEVEKKTNEIRNAHEHLVDAEKLASLGRMAAGVAHELNSPLTGVLSFAHLMKARMTPERAEDIEDLDVIIQQTERCSQIIKGLLGFARKGSAEKIPVNLNDLIEATISIVRNQARFHNIEMRLDFDPGLPQVTLDTNQMQQVFLNLLTNSADAMSGKGAISIVTRVGPGSPGGQTGQTGQTGQIVEAEFTDTGPGIIPDHLNKIFEPFFTTKPVGMGTGLGLPVSYGIVKRHGGEIIVRSTVGKGTTFRITLPVTQPAPRPEPEAMP